MGIDENKLAYVREKLSTVTNLDKDPSVLANIISEINGEKKFDPAACGDEYDKHFSKGNQGESYSEYTQVTNGLNPNSLKNDTDLVTIRNQLNDLLGRMDRVQPPNSGGRLR